MINDTHIVRVIAVTGGKGGVGKTNVSVNLGYTLASQGKRVMLLDADLGLANVDIMLGLKPRQTLEDVVLGRATIDEVLVEGPGGIKIIPAASGTRAMTELSSTQHAGLIQAFSTLSDSIDYLIVDTAAGISDLVVQFLGAVHEILVVVCNEPTSITDAYALIKVMHNDHDVDRFRIVANQVKNEAEGEKLFAKLIAVTDRFLDVTLRYSGAIPFDESVRRAVRKQTAVCQLYPSSKAAAAIRNLALDIQGWPPPARATGRLEFFMEQFVTPRVRLAG